MGNSIREENEQNVRSYTSLEEFRKVFLPDADRPSDAFASKLARESLNNLRFATVVPAGDRESGSQHGSQAENTNPRH